MEAKRVHGPGVVQVTAASAYAPGEVVTLSNRIGVYFGNVAATIGEKVAVATDGIWEVAAKSADVWSAGDQLFWDAGNNALTDVGDSAYLPAGKAVADKASLETLALLDLNGVGRFPNRQDVVESIGFNEQEGLISDQVRITVQLLALDGAVISGVRPVRVWLSNAATGLTVHGTAPSTSTAWSPTVLQTITTDKHWWALANNGTATLTIHDTANTGYYVAAENPATGLVHVSDALTAYLA